MSAAINIHSKTSNRGAIYFSSANTRCRTPRHARGSASSHNRWPPSRAACAINRPACRAGKTIQRDREQDEEEEEEGSGLHSGFPFHFLLRRKRTSITSINWGASMTAPKQRTTLGWRKLMRILASRLNAARMCLRDARSAASAAALDGALSCLCRRCSSESRSDKNESCFTATTVPLCQTAR